MGGIIIYILCVLQPFMSPRYPGGPRVPVRMPNDFNAVSLIINYLAKCRTLNYFLLIFIS